MRKNKIGFIIGALLALSCIAQYATTHAVSPYPPAIGGTGTGAVPSSGQVLIGNGSGNYTPATLTPGTNVTITNASGSVTINATGGSSGSSSIVYPGTGIGVSASGTNGYIVSNSGVTTIGGSTGTISLGSGLSMSGNTLSNSGSGSSSLSTVSPFSPGYLSVSTSSTAFSNSLIYQTAAGQVAVNTTTPDTNNFTVVGSAHADDYTMGIVSSTPVIVYNGDSLTTQIGGAPTYSNMVTPPTIAGQSFVSYNIGQSGWRLAWLLHDASTTMNTLYHRDAAMNIIVIWAGTNDICTGDYTAQQTYNNEVAFGQHERALGWKVIMLDMISRTGCDVANTYLDPQMRANWPTFADEFVDLGATSQLGALGAYTNSTYFQGDGTHLTSTGYALVASYVQAAENDLVSKSPLSAVTLRLPYATSTDCLGTDSTGNVGPGTCGSGASGSSTSYGSSTWLQYASSTPGAFAATHLLYQSTTPSGSVGLVIGNDFSSSTVSTPPSKQFQVNTLSGGSLTNNLVSYYPFEGNSNDFYGTNNGSDANTTYSNSYGKVNQGVDFNGSNAYIDTNASAPWNFGTSSFTISFWLYPTTLSGDMMILGKDSDATGRSWNVNIGNQGAGLLALETLSQPTSTLYGTNLTTVSPLPAANQWYFIRIVDSNASSGSAIYINGVATSTTFGGNDPLPYPQAMNPTATHLFIGKRTYTGYPDNFSGYLDELEISQKTGTANEDTDLYNGGSGQTMISSGGTASSTVLNYPFGLDLGGHLNLSKLVNNTTTAFSLSNCGPSSSFIGGDTGGTATMGSGSPTSCTLNFGGSFEGPPACYFTPYSSVTPWKGAVSSTAVTVNFSANGVPSTTPKFDWFCNDVSK